MRTIVIVANETLPSPDLQAALDERLAAEPARVHVVVPATPVVHRLTWSEEETRVEAGRRLEAYVSGLRDRGIEADGEVGDRNPVQALSDALRRVTGDEVILSTLPPGASRWLGQDVPSQMRARIAIPVAVVTARAAPADTPADTPARG